MSSKQKAFSLFEVLISLSIVLILFLNIMPSFKTFIQHNQIQTSIDQVITIIHFTQQTAIKLSNPVVFCGSSNHRHCDGQWNQGQLVMNLVTQQVFKTYSQNKNYRLVWHSSLGENEALQFEPTGFTHQQGHFTLCLNDNSGVKIFVSRTSRIRIADPEKNIEECR